MLAQLIAYALLGTFVSGTIFQAGTENKHLPWGRWLMAVGVIFLIISMVAFVGLCLAWVFFSFVR